MDAGNVINNLGQPKPADVAATAKVRQKSSDAYAKTARTASADSVDVSSKAKLMHSLREKLKTLPSEEEKVAALKKQAESQTLQMSPEEIVHAILKGSLFNVI